MNEAGTNGEQRVVAVGQWLGTQNRITAMRWSKRLGWVATDISGEMYSQRRPSKSSLIVYCPEGLRTFEEPTDGRTPDPRTPWPKAPDNARERSDG